MHFLALGDSYTIGESVAASERWPVQLARLLREQQIAMDEPTIIARSGFGLEKRLEGQGVVRSGRASGFRLFSIAWSRQRLQ